MVPKKMTCKSLTHLPPLAFTFAIGGRLRLFIYLYGTGAGEVSFAFGPNNWDLHLNGIYL